MRNYILSILTASILSSIAMAFFNEKKPLGNIIRMLCGILIAITIISPITNITFHGISSYIDGINADAGVYVKEGVSVANDKTKGIIKSQTEAYILDKANSLGLDISVNVDLDESNRFAPNAVTISGKVSPYMKKVMSTYLEDTLGILKENQLWKVK